jgi:hypothetical protein
MSKRLFLERTFMLHTARFKDNPTTGKRRRPADWKLEVSQDLSNGYRPFFMPGSSQDDYTTRLAPSTGIRFYISFLR